MLIDDDDEEEGELQVFSAEGEVDTESNNECSVMHLGSLRVQKRWATSNAEDSRHHKRGSNSDSGI